MNTASLYKLDQGDACLSNCFPVRSLFQPSKEGAGHWLVAHRNSVERKYNKLQSIEHEGHCMAEEESVVSGSTKPLDSGKTDTSCNMLDGPLLMRLHCVDKPSELCNVNISDQKLHSAKTEDFEEFDNVAYINASENHLCLELFSRFPILKELELSLNGLYKLRLTAGHFPHLEVLDLSYNYLSSDDVLSIGLLPCLKVLHLTGNELQTLPDNMAAPHHGSTQLTSEQDMHFSSLEALMLDDNKLCSPGVFTSLANLKRLQHLNLQGNCITEVPYLQQCEDEQDLQISSKQPGEDLGHGKVLVSDSEMLATNSKSVERTDIYHLPRVQKEHGKSRTGEDYIHLRTHSSHQFFHLPFPELRFLNLADNKIAAEEALLAVALFPSLTKLVIHSNPLTTQKSGDPPMLTRFLQHRLGIKIRCKKPLQFVKPRIMIPVNPKRKVETKIRKVPKLPLKLEAAGCSFPHDHASMLKKKKENCLGKSIPPECKGVQASSCSSQSSDGLEDAKGVTTDHGTNTLEGKDNDSSEANNIDGDAFFITQVKHQDESSWQVDSEEVEIDSEEDLIPEKFRGYEILLDAKPDPYTFESVGIQQTVRALELALKNLLVYRDSKANLDHLQNPYKEKEKRIGELPPAKLLRLKGEKAEDALTKLKDRTTINKVPLDKVLTGKDVYKKEYEDALTLLREVRKKYKIAHANAGEGAAETECNTHTNRDGKKENQE